ncbi:hypothetical protein DH2020_044102 [Rehmannia glutinosa]|uniref:Mitoferrin-like n=1 Tax=Rehmannia glutinosa TaxID=99300 RepID=A0ABR0UIA1_REHGL
MAIDASPKFQQPELIPLPQHPEYRPEISSGEAHDGLHFWQFMIGGSIAGMVEHMAMFPVDTIKTQMQALGSCPIKSASVNQALQSILKRDGLRGLYRGIGAMGLGAGPAHAVYFSVYEICKKSFSGGNPNNSAAHAMSGICATVASDAVLTPMDMVKQRLQLSNSPYNGVLDCVRRVLREEGIRAFFASYRTTVLMNAPFTAVHFATYEATKKGLMEFSPESVSDERLVIHATAGAAAGALAAALTTPLDVVKTQLQCQAEAPHVEANLRLDLKILLPFRPNVVAALPSKFCSLIRLWVYGVLRLPLLGMLLCCDGLMEGATAVGVGKLRAGVWPHCMVEGVCGCDRFVSGSIQDVFRTIVKKDGYSGLVRGWIPRMLFHAPAAAICWSTYEAAKAFFQELNDSNNSGNVT